MALVHSKVPPALGRGLLTREDAMEKYNVGDTLYCVYFNRRSPQTVTITKVGRKWLHLSNGYRADIDTLILDGGEYSSPGKCWMSQAEYKLHVELDKRWKRIAMEFHSLRPNHLTMADLDEICRLLRI